jgi:hypothetical protein
MSAPIVWRLRRAAVSLGDERVSMQTLAQAHGPAAQGTWLLMMAVPCLLPVPGVGTVLGLGLLALAVTMWRGQTADALPGRVAGLEMSPVWARRVLKLLASAYALAGRWARERLCPIAQAERSAWLAATVGLMAVLLVLPIPFGNVLPALALMLLGLGLVFRDGLVVALGLGAAVAAVGVTAGMALLAWQWVMPA